MHKSLKPSSSTLYVIQSLLPILQVPARISGRSYESDVGKYCVVPET